MDLSEQLRDRYATISVERQLKAWGFERGEGNYDHHKRNSLSYVKVFLPAQANNKEDFLQRLRAVIDAPNYPKAPAIAPRLIDKILWVSQNRNERANEEAYAEIRVEGDPEWSKLNSDFHINLRDVGLKAIEKGVAENGLPCRGKC